MKLVSRIQKEKTDKASQPPRQSEQGNERPEKSAAPRPSRASETENSKSNSNENENSGFAKHAESITENQSQEASKAKLRRAIETEPSVARVVKASRRLADRIEESDRDLAKQVITEAMSATNRNYDKQHGGFDIYPDHKTRLAAATLLLAYDEGRPVERQVTVTGTFKSADDILARIRQSPEAMKAIAGPGLALEIGGQVIEGDFQAVEKPDLA